MKTLLAFSAGYDSTYLLYKLMAETDDEVRCFWMDTSNVQIDHPKAKPNPFKINADAEHAAIPPIMDWMAAHFRPVMIETTVTTSFEPYGWRVPVMIAYAAERVRDLGYDRFWFGRSPENIRNARSKDREKWYRRLWKELAPRRAVMETPLIDWWQGRQHAIAALPADLQALISYCNYPPIIDGKPGECGKCDKCEITKESREMLASGVTPDVAQDYFLRLRKAAHYTDFLCPDRRFGGEPEPPWASYRMIGGRDG